MPRLPFVPRKPGAGRFNFGVGNVVIQKSRFVMSAGALPIVPQSAGCLIGGDPEFLNEITKGRFSKMDESNRMMASNPFEEPVTITPERPEGRYRIPRPKQWRGFDKI